MDDHEPVSPEEIIAAQERAGKSWADNYVRRDPAVDPEQLLANPANPRIHPTRQQKAMHAIFMRLGWVGDVIVNERTGRVIDGHMRISLAITHGQKVPVTYVDLDEKAEREVLAVYDAVGRMAIIDTDMYEDLVQEFDDPGAALTAMFNDMLPTTTPDQSTGSSDNSEVEASADVMYGVVGWSETKVKATTDEVGRMTTLHQRYRAENGGTDDGFVTWLLAQSHPD